jgi:hypothetical protein
MNQDYNNNKETQQDEDLTNKFKLSIIFLVTLSALRVFNLDILWTLSDLISAAVVYFTFTSKSGLMAIFCLVNGIIGIIYSVIKGVNDYKASVNSSGLKFFYMISVIFFALFTYTFLSIYSYKAYKLYKKDFGGQEQSNTPSSNYGALSQESQPTFKPFSGKGYSLA